MCGRFTNQASWTDYHNALRGFLGPAHQAWKAPAELVTPRYNLAPTQLAPIIIRDGDGLEGVMARWDFVPWFHKGPLEAKKWSGINARIGTCAKSGAFRDAVRKRRCLVPNHGFFEWKPEGKAKVRFGSSRRIPGSHSSPASGTNGMASTRASRFPLFPSPS